MVKKHINLNDLSISDSNGTSSPPFSKSPIVKRTRKLIMTQDKDEYIE